jgi:hypothetical protein
MKAFVKLYKVEKKDGKEKLRLVDTQFFTNREAFGYISRGLK